MPLTTKMMEKSNKIEEEILSADLTLIVDVIFNAGQAASQISKTALKSWTKTDKSPVTEADYAVNEIFKTHLTRARPDYLWLSEEDPETHDSVRQIIAQSKPETPVYTWCIDPIDGTRGFMEGNDHWVISVALLENDQPILGVVYNPTQDLLFTAIKDQGAKLNGQRLELAVSTDRPLPLVYTKKKLRSDPDFSDFLADQKISYLSSLAMRICTIAMGKADACILTTPCSIWDIAASQIILKEAGGSMSKLDLSRLAINAENFKISNMILGTPKYIKAYEKHFSDTIALKN